MLCFSSCLFKTLPPQNNQYALIGQLTQAGASTGHKSRAAVLNQFLRSKLAAGHILWCSVTKSHNLRSSVKDFLWHLAMEIIFSFIWIELQGKHISSVLHYKYGRTIVF